LAANIKAGSIRQAHIKDNQVGVMVTSVTQTLAALIFPNNAIPLSLQPGLQALGYGRVIFDNKNVVSVVHSEQYCTQI
jgi:hypothetical protein